jgi:hypothetical protein
VRRTTIALLLGLAVPAGAAPIGAPVPGASLHIGPFAGTIVLDQHLSDYRWDTSARAVWGLAGRAGLGPFGAGMRVWRTATSQSTGIPGVSTAPEVTLTSGEAVGEAKIFSLLGARLFGTGTVGLLRLGYDPDVLSVDDGAGGTTQVRFQPVTEWTGGLGLGVRRGLIGGLEATVGVDHTWFQLDTAHRVGSEIVEDRETFGNWTARVELTHRVLQI